MRLFIGMALAPEAAAELQQIRQRLAPAAGELRWSQPETWHVTLQFLGAASGEQFTCISRNLAAVHAARVPVHLAGLGFFDRAGVFWAGVERTPQLLALQQKVLAATRGCSFVPEDRAYNPHITLARAKGRAGARALAPLQQALQSKKLSIESKFLADEFLLYESFPGAEGSRYEVRARFPLLES